MFTAEPAWEYDTAGTAGARHLVNTHIEILSADRGNDFDTRKHLYDVFCFLFFLNGTFGQIAREKDIFNVNDALYLDKYRIHKSHFAKNRLQLLTL